MDTGVAVRSVVEPVVLSARSDTFPAGQHSSQYHDQTKLKSWHPHAVEAPLVASSDSVALAPLPNFEDLNPYPPQCPA